MALFVGLVATKFALGTLAYFWHVDDGAGLGEVLVMIAVMIAVQAELVSRRAARRTSRWRLRSRSWRLRPSAENPARGVTVMPTFHVAPPP